MKILKKPIAEKPIAEKPITEWEQIVLKLINGELEVVEETQNQLSFKYNNNQYSAWIGNRDTSYFGTLNRVNHRIVDNIIQKKTQIRPEIQEKLKVFVKPTDNEILQKFEEKHFKL